MACKKNSNDTPTISNNIDSFSQSVIYRVNATVASPADSAKGVFKDSISAIRIARKDDHDFLTNLPNISANISSNSPGFSFGYNDQNRFLHYFSFTANAFHSVPREFELNKLYEHTTIPGSINQRPLFLGNNNGIDGMTYFVNNVFPADAEYPPLSKTYMSIKFTKRTEIPFPQMPSERALLASGIIVGYCIDYYNKTDSAKYVHRWDFTVDFTNLRIDH